MFFFIVFGGRERNEGVGWQSVARGRKERGGGALVLPYITYVTYLILIRTFSSCFIFN